MASSTAFDAAKSTYVFGKGEFSGLIANLRALIVAITPLIHTKAYQLGLKVGQTGGAFLTAGVFVLVAEYVHRKYVVSVRARSAKISIISRFHISNTSEEYRL